MATLEVMASPEGLAVDDVIEAVMTEAGWFRWAVPGRVRSPVHVGGSGHCRVELEQSGLRCEMVCKADDVFRVKRTLDAAIAAPGVATVSRWNGKCPRCGCGTYTGYLSVEHEADHCR